MVEKAIVEAVKRYLAQFPALDQADEWSDIDLIVIAREFDGSRKLTRVERLWLATASADNRIEPIPCGERESETEQGRAILEIARRERIVITA